VSDLNPRDDAAGGPGRKDSSEPDGPRVGLDFGRTTTRLALPDEAGGVEVVAIPTVLGYSGAQAAPIRVHAVGARALSRRDHLKLVSPFEVSPTLCSELVRDFAAGVLEELGDRFPTGSWGVINCPIGATDREASVRRRLAAAFFDRFVTADDDFLVAVGLGSLEISSHCAVVNVGSEAVSAALIYGGSPRPEDRTVVDYGAACPELVLRNAIGKRYPELDLTRPTLREIKEEFAFVAPARRRAVLDVRFQGFQKHVDLTELVQNAFASLLGPLLKAVRGVLAMCPSDDIEAFQGNIVLAGGYAAIDGLGDRLQSELRADGFEHARVLKPDSASELVARGAALWARCVPEKEWGIPLFTERSV
jgi:hypothetical protein